MLLMQHITGSVRKWKRKNANFPQTHEDDIELEGRGFVREGFW